MKPRALVASMDGAAGAMDDRRDSRSSALRDPSTAVDRARRAWGHGDPEDSPFITVVIPAHGRPNQLRACLAGLQKCDYPTHRLEVIVVDDGSRVPLIEAIAPFRGALQLRFISQSNRGPGAARNAGAALADGMLLAFVDDDCIPARGWLRALARQFRQTPDRLIGGQIVNALPDNAYSTSSHLITRYTYEYYEQSPKAERFFTTNNMAVATAAFRALDGFDTSFPSGTAEDKEFCDRWRRAGGHLAFVSDAIVHHAHHLTFGSFLRQHHNYGRGIYCFRIGRPRESRARLRPEPYSFYTDLLAYPLRASTRPKSWLHACLVLMSQFATVTGAARAALVDVKRMRRRTQAAAVR